MGRFEFRFTGLQGIEVVHPETGHRWYFAVVLKGTGQRKLNGPIAIPPDAASDGELMHAACRFAREQALKAGWIDG